MSLTSPVRFSALRRMSQSPAHYRWAVENDTEQTLAMRLGSGFHELMSGQSVAVFDGIRRGKAWDAFQAEHEHETILNVREHAQASALVAALRSDPLAAPLVERAGSVEKLLGWQYGQRECRGTPDAYGNGVLLELKSTRCAEPGKFNRDGLFRGYHSQVAWYLDGLAQCGIAVSDAYLIAVESTPPHPVTVMRVTDRALDRGRRLYRFWWEQLMVCESSNDWPGYCGSIMDFDAPDDSLQLVVDGEELDMAS